MILGEIVTEQIRHHGTERVPYTLSFEADIARSLDRRYGEEGGNLAFLQRYLRDLGIGADVTERLDRHYGSEPWRRRLLPYIASCGGIGSAKRQAKPMGEGLSRDLFGCVWRMDRRPIHLEETALSGPSLEGYSFPDAEAFVGPQLEKNTKKAMDDSPGSFHVFGVGWGVWETYWSMRGFENALMDSALEEDFFAEVLERLTDMQLVHIAQAADISADAIMVGDDWSDQRGVMIGLERWRCFLKPCYARIYKAAHDQGKFVMHHCCGSVADIMPDLIEIGLDVLESAQPEAVGMNPYELKKRWGDKITFWGCLGSQSTISFGNPQEVHDEVLHLCREMGAGGGYILAPAKPLQPETPTENAVAIIETFTNQSN